MTETPAYLRRQRKNDARLTPCRRSRSGTGTPASASFRIPTIWLSVNFDLRMTTPEPGAVYRRPLTYRGSLRGQHAISARQAGDRRAVTECRQVPSGTVDGPACASALGKAGARPSDRARGPALRP